MFRRDTESVVIAGRGSNAPPSFVARREDVAMACELVAQHAYVCRRLVVLPQ